MPPRVSGRLSVNKPVLFLVLWLALMGWASAMDGDSSTCPRPAGRTAYGRLTAVTAQGDHAYAVYGKISDDDWSKHGE